MNGIIGIEEGVKIQNAQLRQEVRRKVSSLRDDAWWLLRRALAPTFWGVFFFGAIKYFLSPDGDAAAYVILSVTLFFLGAFFVGSYLLFRSANRLEKSLN